MLDEAKQAEATWNGEFIADRVDQEHTILLYQVDDFYVEVYYHQDDNVIKRFRSFSSIEQLIPYLEQIDIVNLLNG
jgi:hypothetical protein